MCGILGALPAVNPVLFKGALDTLQHRGPDGEGILHCSDFEISLGHRRLSILDTSELASQPMSFVNRYYIVFNGEIYNFIEIRRELELLGHTFKSNSDTEVLLKAFVEWGELCVERLNGMWAFAIWDSLEKRLFLSRDRVGEKPFFYIQQGTKFIFASEQKALLPFLSEIRPSDYFNEFCRHSYAYEGTSWTLFKGVNRFPAGHIGWYEHGSLRLKRYWKPESRTLVLPRTYEERVESLRELLLDSCRLRLRSDVPVGTALSGGVDSSAVAASIAQVAMGKGEERISENWQNAFVASFPNTVMDESIPARKIADYLRIKFLEVQIIPEVHVKNIENWAYLFEEVHEVNPIPHITLYREMRKNGILVSLDGHGGDELFCGYESSILHALPSAFPNRKDLNMILETYSNIHPANDQFGAMGNWRILPHLFKSMLSERKRVHSDPALEDFSLSRDSLGKHLIGLTFGTVLPTLLRNYDRYSMINGVEIRSPLLDHRIIEFAFALNWNDKIRNGYSKSILRDAVKPWLPDGIVNNKTKIGFAPPIIDWMRGPLKEYLLDETASIAFEHSSLVNSVNLRKSIQNLVSGDHLGSLYNAESIWKEFGVYLWEKAFINTNRRILSN